MFLVGVAGGGWWSKLEVTQVPDKEFRLTLTGFEEHVFTSQARTLL